MVYHTTKVGTKLVYVHEGDKNEIVDVVMAVKDEDGAKLVTMGFMHRGEPIPEHVMSVSDKGLCIVDTNVTDLREPFWLLKLPHKAGNKWEAVIAPSGFCNKFTGTATSETEEVKVPAGTFEAIRVKLDIVISGERKQITTWYAPHVGKVKEVRGDDIELLKSFTLGKD